MYILVTCRRIRTKQKCTFAYNGEEELKKEVVKILDARGWDNKHLVDLRKARSCIEYILGGRYRDIEYKFSSSYNKYLNYKNGKNALVE